MAWEAAERKRNILTLARKLEAVHRTTTINNRIIPRVRLAKHPRAVPFPCLISGMPGLSGDSEFSLLSSVTGNGESLLLLGEREEDEAVAAIFTATGGLKCSARSREVCPSEDRRGIKKAD